MGAPLCGCERCVAGEDMSGDTDVIHICAGPPVCCLEDDEAVEAMKAGCVWCRRVRLADDGTKTETGPGQP